MNYYVGNLECSDSLSHHGIKGQRWGIRRFQNPDGTWTEAGKVRYGDDGSDGDGRLNSGSDRKRRVSGSNTQDVARKEKIKKAVKTAAIVVGGALAVYGTYKLSQVVSTGDYNYKLGLASKLDDLYGQRRSEMKKLDTYSGTVTKALLRTKTEQGRKIIKDAYGAAHFDTYIKDLEHARDIKIPKFQADIDRRFDPKIGKLSSELSKADKASRFVGGRVRNAVKYYRGRGTL